MNLLGGRTQSNDNDQRGIPHMASPWTTQIFVDNAYLPANVRQAMIDQGVNNFVMEKQGQWLGQSGNWGDSEDRHNQFDSWTLQLGFDKDLGDNWQVEARIQRGATDRLSQVFNEIRVDRETLAVDAVEVYNDRRERTAATGDGRARSRCRMRQRGTGTIVCNVQRYNPTDEQLAASVANIRVPATQGDDSLRRRGSDRTGADSRPRGSRRDQELRADEHLRSGQTSAHAAAEYARPAKWGVGHRRAGVRGGALQGRDRGRLRTRPVVVAAGSPSEQSFWQRGYPAELMSYGPPFK